MFERLTPALLVRDTKHFVVARNFSLNRGTVTALLWGLTAVVLYCLPNRERIAFEAVQIGMPKEALVQTLAGLEFTVVRDHGGESRIWRDRVKFPLRRYQVTLRDGQVTSKRVLP